MEFKGTRGTWNVIIPTYEQTNGFVNVSTEDGDISCYNGMTKGGAHPKSLANALLISKSLEMLEELNNQLEFLIYCRDNMKVSRPVFNQKIVRIKQLIKEATEIKNYG
jgi:hypothetical protein